MNDVLHSMGSFFLRLPPARFAVVLAVVAGLALASASLVSAQASEVRITELQCNSDPEVVTITNQGSQSQDLTGWTLQSDPVGSESYDLSAAGVLASGVSIFVQAGSKAEGSFVWSREPVLRDTGSADFARLVDATGSTVDEVKCQSASPTQAATATARPTAAPTAAPTAPADGVPVGGGPPGTGSWQSAGVMLVAGSWLLAAALGALVLARLRSGAQAVAVAPVQAYSPVIPGGTTPDYGRWLYLLLVLVLAAVAGLATASHNRHRPRSP